VASADPVEAGSSEPDDDWAVQVGAYRSREPAYEAARHAIEKAPSLLGDGIIKIVPLKKKKHTLYRARIVGFDKDRADTACRTLERAGVACLVVSMKGVQVASNL
jgi:D-alanyl-D-alanine carboxypeptidase